MADVTFLLNQTRGKPLYLQITRDADDYIYDYSNSTFKDPGVVVDEKIPLVEDAGTYSVTVDFTAFDDGEYLVECFDTDYGFHYCTARTLHVQNGTTLEDDVRDNVALDEDAGGTDNLRYVESDGSAIPGAVITVWKESEYGHPDTQPVGITLTDNIGRWSNAVLVPPGDTYRVIFHKPNYFGPNSAQVVV